MGQLWDIMGHYRTFVTFFQNKDVFTGDFYGPMMIFPTNR
jgi:hypothetical protein